MATLEVVCPPNVSEGMAISVQDPSGGGTFDVIVPPGVGEGEVFLVEPPIEQFMHIAAPQMDPGSAELLRAVLQALHDDESLDEFVDEHSEKFRDYEPDGEQSLAWGSLHMEYVALVERVLESVLESGKGSADDLYALLESQKDTPRGERFLDKFLSMGDYHVFCSMMATWTNLESVKAQSRYIDEEQRAIDEL